MWLTAQEHFKEQDKPLPEVGWWRYSKENGTDILNDKMWLNKPEETLHVSEKEETDKLNQNNRIINPARGLGTI